MPLKLSEITDRIMSASATIIAVVALATGLYQAKLSRDQAKAAVWPYIISGNSGENGFARIVQNVGLGPAIIGSFEVHVDGTPEPPPLHLVSCPKGSHGGGSWNCLPRSKRCAG